LSPVRLSAGNNSSPTLAVPARRTCLAAMACLLFSPLVRPAPAPQAPEVVCLQGLNPRACASIALRRARRCGPSAARPTTGRRSGSSRQLQGDDFMAANVGSGSNQADQGLQDRPFIASAPPAPAIGTRSLLAVPATSRPGTSPTECSFTRPDAAAIRECHAHHGDRPSH
jgi:hypothetical protein